MASKSFGANREHANSLLAITILSKNLFFFVFELTFAWILYLRLTQAGPWGGRISRMVQDLLHTLFRRWKKTLLSAITYRRLTRGRPKTFRNKCNTNAFRRCFWRLACHKESLCWWRSAHFKQKTSFARISKIKSCYNIPHRMCQQERVPEEAELAVL